MKLFIATLYLVITFLSASFHSETILFSSSDNSSKPSISALTDCCYPAGDHSGSRVDCGTCHTGHCSYVVNATVAPVFPLEIIDYPNSSQLLHLKNYHSVILRPPIA